MKKLLLFLVFVFVGHIAKAQLNDIYLSNDIVLSDNQWHFDDYSVIEAMDNNYLLITPNQYYYRHLPPFSAFDFAMCSGDRVRSYKPYVYNNAFGWYVEGVYHNYFYCPTTMVCIRLSYIPVFYNFYYHFNRRGYIDLRCWHWRPHGHYHHLWKPPHHHYDGYRHKHHGYDKPRLPQHNGYSRPYNNSPKGDVRHHEPLRGNSVRPHDMPLQNRSVTRPVVPHSRGSATVRQSPPSRNSPHSRQPSSRSSHSNRRYR